MKVVTLKNILEVHAPGAAEPTDDTIEMG